jgi:hypothetical protein
VIDHPGRRFGGAWVVDADADADADAEDGIGQRPSRRRHQSDSPRAGEEDDIPLGRTIHE